MMAGFVSCVGIKSSAIDLKRIKSYVILFMGFKRNSIKIKKHLLEAVITQHANLKEII